MDQSKHTPSDLAETTTPQKQQEDEIQLLKACIIVVSIPCNITFDVIYVLLACNITIDITFDNLFEHTIDFYEEKKGQSIAKKPKKNEDVQKETKIIAPTKETTPTSENTPTRRTKANAARRLTLENPKPIKNHPTTPSSNVNPTPTATIQEPKNETNQQPPSTNVDTTPQTEKTNQQNTNNISPVISNESTDTSTTLIQETTNETPNQSPEIQDKAADEDGKKRKRTETESPERTTRGSMKKQQLEKKRKEPLKKRKRVEKPKNKAEERKKMDKKRKEEVKPLYEATKTLTPERKTKIREMGFGTLLDFPFEKIPRKLPYFVVKNLDTKTMKVTFPSGSKLKITPKKIWEVLGIPMGKNKLESDSPREYDDELLKAFNEQFHNKKYITISDLSKQIQRTTNTYFMFQMNYLMLFSNCMIHCDNSSRLIYYLIYLHYTKIDGMVMMQSKWPALRNWTSQDAMDRENFEMSKGRIGLVEVIEDDDKEDENEKDAEKWKLRELVYETIEEKFQNVLKEKTKLEHLLKEYMEMDELFSGDEKLTLYVKKFKEEFTKGFRKDEERAGTSEENEATEMGIYAEISVKKDAGEKQANKASEMRQAAEKEAAEKEAAEKEAAAMEKEEAEKIATAKKKKQAEKLSAAKKKEKAEKLAAAKKKEQAEKLATTKKKEEDEKLAAANKEQAEKLAATKKKEEAEKLAATKKEQAEKLAATKKKEEAEKKAAAEKEAASKKKEEAEKKAAAEKEKAEKEAASKKKEEAEKKAATEKEKAEKEAAAKKEATEKKDAGTAKTKESEATTISNTFESPKVQEKIFRKGQESADKSSKDEPKIKEKDNKTINLFEITIHE
ncbi:hypothetical protein Tco_0153954 [Tanacetum coccineum]